ncbi:MAG: 16S rRNA (cytidine(1402)-2'-O)-methyltransferase [Verrucomicrobiota bacterium]
MSTEKASGRVALVPTPIGHLGDMTYRGVATLKEADVVACEDTRHSLRLFQCYEIPRKTLLSLHARNELSRSKELIERAKMGQQIAVVTDAGMPCLSDPGYRFVRLCLEENLPVTVLPGACAAVTAIAGSGLPSDAFHYFGFLPQKAGRRGKALAKALALGETSVFYESPYRIAKTLAQLAELDPEAEVCVARELSKRFETYHRGSALELAGWFQEHPAKGEISLVLSPSAAVSRHLD